MPKLYEYFGVLVMFYSNEHEPVHVHGKHQGRESRAELILVDGVVTEIRYGAVVGRPPLAPSELRYFEEIVSAALRRDRDQVDRLLRAAQTDQTRTHHQETEVTPAIINVLTADFVGDYRIRLHFDDSSEQTVDFGPFLEASVHPEIRAWLDPDRFQAFRVQYGELVWGDYEFCFPMIDLYRNKIDHRNSLEAVA